MRSKVVLPAPFGPTMVTNSPGRISRSMPRRAMKGPNCLVRELATINYSLLFFHQLDELSLQLGASSLIVDLVDLAFRKIIVQRGDLIDQGFLLNGYAAV